MKRELEAVEIPGAHDARERAWAMARGALAEREVVPVESHRLRLAVAIAVVAAVVAAALSPPGRAVLDEIREAVGVERAQQGLFSLPAQGQVLVGSDAGVWVVHEDGSKRLLGDYREASWSPFGRFVVAAGTNELVALEPDGDLRWTLGRPRARSPRWSGTEADTRIAYVDRTGVRVVAGDGTGDRLLAPYVAPFAWRPGPGHVLATLRGGELQLHNVESGRVLRQVDAGPVGEVLDLSWSPDGRSALIAHPDEIVLVDVARGTRRSIPVRERDAVAATFSPNGRTVAVLRPNAVLVVDAAGPRSAPRRIFAGAGPFSGLTWSPDGRWLLVGWPAADQWVFVRADGGSIRAVANVSKQFRSTSFPEVEGWVP